MPERFKHPRVRDLAWIIGSPVLLQPGQPSMPAVSDSECNALFTEALPHLVELDADNLVRILNEWRLERRRRCRPKNFLPAKGLVAGWGGGGLPPEK